MKISDINLKIILDSRGKDTLEARFKLGDLEVIASVPAGKSTGKFEAAIVEPKLSIQKFEGIKKEILNKDFSSVLEFDNFLRNLDGTENKSNLGGNLILVLSIGFTKLLAKSQNLEVYQLIAKILDKNPTKFPYLYLNLIGGGLHAKDSLPFQEYILVTKFSSPKKGLEFAINGVEKLKKAIKENFGDLRFGDEGAFAIKSDNPEVGLEVLQRNLSDPEVSFALDVAASIFFKDGTYLVGQKIMSKDELLSYYELLTINYQLLSIEDPFSEDDMAGFEMMTKRLRDKIWIIGDDLTVTNPEKIKLAEEKQAVNAVIIKPNQIGSVSETLEAIKLAQSYGWKIIVSHRSGETMDDFIADLAFGVEADGLKSGAPTQPQRLAKYNRLIEIEDRLTQNSNVKTQN